MIVIEMVMVFVVGGGCDCDDVADYNDDDDGGCGSRM